MDLISKSEFLDDDYVNDLTKEMDEYLIGSWKQNRSINTYIYRQLGNRYQAIRYPGATRGHIEIDKNDIIIDIKLYSDELHTDSIYEKNVSECFSKYIGRKLVFI